MGADELARRRSDRRDEQGFVLVWFTILFIVLLAIAAFVVDLTHAYSASQQAQNSADASALGGVVVMPDFDDAEDLAEQIAQDNGVDIGDVTVEATGVDNQLKVTIRHRVGTFFAPAIGIDSLTVTRSATAEYQAPEPLDLVMIIDRTGSMTPTDLANAKNAARAVLEFLDPALEHVALGVLGPSSTSQQCTGANAGAYGRPAASAADPTATWLASPYPAAMPAGDYQLADGSLNPNSQVVRTIDCLATSGVGTNLGTPIERAQSYFASSGRPGARRGLILLSDGAANEPNNQSCQFAFEAASDAQTAGISMVTIGFGVAGDRCIDAAGSSYPNGTALTKLLSDMASPINGEPADDQGCTEAENQDGDNFFCEPREADLEAVFVQAAAQLVGRSPTLVD